MSNNDKLMNDGSGKSEIGISRRTLLGASIAGSVAAVTGANNILAQTDNGRNSGGELLLKSGYVLSMDQNIGDIRVGDVHIIDGVIIKVAESIEAPGAEIIDARNTVIMPGFVETHWHMWNSSWRGMADDAAEYFGFGGRLAPVYTTQDHYVAVRYAALDALNAGITTCHNWAHGIREFNDVEAEMQALVDTGIRAKMGYMASVLGAATPATDLNRALEWINVNGQGRLGLGLLVEGGGPEEFESAVELGRSLGLRPITNHGGGLARPDIAGAEFVVTHGTGLTAEAIQVIRQNNIKVALSPLIDPMIGGGLSPIYPLITGGVPLENISFSVDVSAQTPVDPFAAVRAIVNAGRIQQTQANATAQNSGFMNVPTDSGWAFTYRDALYIGTYGGANVLGLQDQVGSLTPGKRADVIMVRTDAMNMLPLNDVNMNYQLVQNGLPSNVDTVIADGHIKKRNGALVDINLEEVIAETAASQAAIRERAGVTIDQLR